MLTRLKKKIPYPLKSKAKLVIHQGRMLNWKSRLTPDFIIIGGQKCGTSSLYNYLAQHPQILPASKKEIHYFDNGLDSHQKNFERGESWYRAHFPLKNSGRESCLTFEASPTYCVNPLVAKRIQEFNPKIKIIFCIRDPKARAISHYYHEVMNGREVQPILKALKLEESRIENAVNSGKYEDRAFTSFSYKTRGLYADQMQRYLDCFDSSQVHLMSAEDLFSNPERTLKQAYHFLSIDSEFRDLDLKPVNVSPLKKEVDLDVIRYLDNFFEEPNQRLFELLDRRFDWT